MAALETRVPVLPGLPLQLQDPVHVARALLGASVFSTVERDKEGASAGPDRPVGSACVAGSQLARLVPDRPLTRSSIFPGPLAAQGSDSVAREVHYQGVLQSCLPLSVALNLSLSRENANRHTG